MRNPAHSGVPLLWWTWTLAPTLRPAPTVPVHVAEEHRPALIKGYAWQGRWGRRTVRLHSCGLPVVSFTRPTGAQVFALFPPGCEPSSFQRLVIPPYRPPPAQLVTGSRVRLLGWTGRPVHFASDTGQKKQGYASPVHIEYKISVCF